ncbi:MAG: SPASM domain-containing protein, partial [Clostridiales bacterium]|nr:SPASM domain-containing protein [Clostridiales bacterium]
NFFHFMIDLDNGPCAVKRLRGCGCGNDYIAVTPNGDIYPCHQFVGIESWRMGNLTEKTFRDDIKTYFSKTHIYTKTGCRDCWARFYCSGGCNANSFIYEGDCKTPYKLGCELQKKRLECAIGLVVENSLKDQG